MKSLTLLVFLVIIFQTSKVTNAAVLSPKNCALICLSCPELNCASGSYPLFRTSNACKCCPTCITPKVGDACYTVYAHNASAPLSCGAILKCCNNSTCKEIC